LPRSLHRQPRSLPEVGQEVVAAVPQAVEEVLLQAVVAAAAHR
jgi:hypothetical protein